MTRSVVALLIVLTLLAGCGGDQGQLVGTDLRKVASPDFSLRDQRGTEVSLRALRGRVVVLTFIYTNCPDICPLTLLGFRESFEMLSDSERENVAFVAITVDPERDTWEVLEAYSARFDLNSVPGWHALSGNRAELEPIWGLYGIDAFKVRQEVESHVSGSGRPLEVSHTDAIYVIDADGNQRVLMRSTFEAKDLASNIRALT